jgi:hypothetical protein
MRLLSGQRAAQPEERRCLAGLAKHKIAQRLLWREADALCLEEDVHDSGPSQSTHDLNIDHQRRRGDERREGAKANAEGSRWRADLKV